MVNKLQAFIATHADHPTSFHRGSDIEWVDKKGCPYQMETIATNYNFSERNAVPNRYEYYQREMVVDTRKV